MAMIKGVHHIALRCGDRAEYQKTIAFYHELLGMEIVRSWGTGDDLGTMLNNGNSLMEIFSRGKVSGSYGAVHHIALATDDVDGCVEAVRAAGYEITMEPKEIVIASCPEFPARIAFCVGPVGESIEFFCER